MKRKRIESITRHAFFLAAVVSFAPVAHAGITDVVVVQTGFRFSSDDGVTRVLVTWTETGGNPSGVDVFRDDELVVHLDAAPEDGERSVELESEPEGEHVYRVEGSDGAFGEQLQTVLPSSPVGDPFDLECATDSPGCALSGDEESCEIIIVWRNDGPFEGEYRILVEDEEALGFEMDPSESCRVITAPSPGEQTVTMFAFAEEGFDGEPGNYRSAIARASCDFECDPPRNAFTRGVCNGAGDTPTITSVIFGLGFLFLGGPPPPCLEACDADGDGAFVITDIIYVLDFLFLGGEPPRGWLDADGDGDPDPTCETEPIEGCGVSHDTCRAPGGRP